MTHLSRSDLAQFAADPHGAGRSRILAHLAECDACGEMYGEVLDAEVSAAADASPFVPLGLAAGPKGLADPQRQGAWMGRRVLPYAGLAAAALVALTVWMQPPERVTPETGPAIRGNGLQPVAPVGDVRGSVRFEWATAIQATTFRVVVTDENGAMVWSESTAGSGVVLDPSPLKPGMRYEWRVSALDESGAVLTESPPRVFVWRRD